MCKYKHIINNNNSIIFIEQYISYIDTNSEYTNREFCNAKRIG